MNIAVELIDTRTHLQFIQSASSPSFLQLPSWANVKPDWSSLSIGWRKAGQLVGVGLVLERMVPCSRRLKFSYLAEGPLIDWSGDIHAYLDPLAQFLRSRGSFALRIGPPVRTHTWSAAQVKAGIADPRINHLTDLSGTVDPLGTYVTDALAGSGWLPQGVQRGFGIGHPQFTFELPLQDGAGRPRTEEALLKDMSQQWRRNIRRSETAQLEVGVDDDLPAFHELYVETAHRDRFTPRPIGYFQKMFAALRAEYGGEVSLYLARHHGVPVAGAIMTRAGDRAWYAYGASGLASRPVRASNACQWAMIRDALHAGCSVYDLRGITPSLDVNDRHLGLIQFKVGSGGQAVRYVGEWDRPLRPLPYVSFRWFMNRRSALRRR